MRIAGAVLATWVALAGGARAQEAAADPAKPAGVSWYAAGLATTTVANRPASGPLAGPVHDLTPALGVGASLTPQLAVELDAGPTLLRGRVDVWSAVPGIVWSFHPTFYAACRASVPLAADRPIALGAALGGSRRVGARASLLLEVGALATVTRATPDVGLALTLGTLLDL